MSKSVMGGFLQPFKDAIDYLSQKTNLATATSREIEGRAHDRSFVIAGAMKDALLTDMHNAVIDALKNGKRLEDFRQDFESIVKKHGWRGWKGENSEAGRAWRARTIYETNLRTAQAAGRYKQMTDPDMVKVRPYWQYKHGFVRRPKRPRANHLALDGLILLHDDPAWNKIYPPNDWGCTCGVVPLSKRQLERMGKSVNDSPQLNYRKVKDPRTGKMVDVPEGIGVGWDHAPGQDWAQGLSPNERGATSNFSAADKPQDRIDSAEVIKAIMSMFGADKNESILVKDATGFALALSRQMFKPQIAKERATILKSAFAALAAPQDIRLGFAKRAQNIQILCRFYIGKIDDQGNTPVLEWASDGWAAYQLEPKDLNRLPKQSLYKSSIK
ncbi:phage head morphogenesis protein [Bartonella sp. HY761]|uniref:phage head morphogenesis protein n=1 Tax=Bartonella sp. HY761 TaxID=2979330 RepID=UPI00220556D4|nr:phage minor head protein [Bartonella sp. HY761]UXN07524.1 phage head morphogenesis protein [Bartonella sp. HY761]